MAHEVSRWGKTLSIIGYLWLILYLMDALLEGVPAPMDGVLAFFGSSLLIPIAFIIAGWVISRRAKRVSTEDVFGTRPEPARQPAPPRPRPRAVESEPEPEAKAVSELVENLEEEIIAKAGEMAHRKSSEEMIAEARRRWGSDR